MNKVNLHTMQQLQWRVMALQFFLFFIFCVGFFIVFQSKTFAFGAPTRCSGTPATFSTTYVKQLLPLPNESICSQTQTGTCGRSYYCVVPKKIVMHTTWGSGDANGIYQYFSSGAEYRGVGSHFVIGKDGKTIQMVEMLKDKVEYAQAVGSYSDHISIELVHTGNYGSKWEMPTAQYQAAQRLVASLMRVYSIPIGTVESSWVSSYSGVNPHATPGIYGHYQLNPFWVGDPGSGWLGDFRADMKTFTAQSTNPTQTPVPTRPQATPTPANRADLVVTSLRLTDSAGNVKTSFRVNERIYVKVTLKNQGTAVGTSSSDYTYSQIYSHKPSTVTYNTVSDKNISLKNGEFGVEYYRTYNSYAGSSTVQYFPQNKSWTMSSPGTYTARAFINFNKNVAESNFDNNQTITTYTVN